MTGRRRSATSAGLSARLLTAQLIVIVTAVLTAWLVAAAVGPAIFHRHLTRVADGGAPMQAQLHAERAFRDASIVSTAVALVVALAVAVAASAYVTRRISRPVVALARAAGEVAAGRYQIEVPKPALGREFDVLAQSFSAMAGRLGSVETTRRRLLADLAHEMRTPVATLDAYLEGIEDGVATLDRQTSAILRDQTRRLRRLAEDMAAVSRAEEHQLDLHRMPVPPAQLLTAAVDAAADRYATARVRLELDLSPEVGEVEVDVDRFGQVLGNLLDNALRHTPSGGRVVVRLRRSRDTIAFTVSDTGEGIAAEHLPHVFERFYRVDAARDRARGGSGIGLAIVKAVVEAHGGCVRVSSDGDGRGSTLTLTLPVVTTAARSATAPMPAP